MPPGQPSSPGSWLGCSRLRPRGAAECRCASQSITLSSCQHLLQALGPRGCKAPDRSVQVEKLCKEVQLPRATVLEFLKANQAPAELDS
jgi:hypothetical protein